MAKKKRTTKRPARTPSRPRDARSQHELATALRRSQSAISLWTKRPDWPFGRPIRWPLAISEVRAWVEATLTKDPADVGVDERPVEVGDGERATIRKEMGDLDPLKLARLQKIVAETKTIRRKNQILEQFYIERAQARGEINAIIHNTTTGILAEARSSAKAIDALGALGAGWKKRVAKLLLERAEGLCHRFADSMNDVIDRQS